MKVNHFILKTDNVGTSCKFYCDILDFTMTSEDAGHPKGRVLENDSIHIIVLPKRENEPSNPFHIAFELESLPLFSLYYERLLRVGIEPRKWPQNDAVGGIGGIKRAGKEYKIYYFDDPSGTLLEMMCCVQ